MPALGATRLRGRLRRILPSRHAFPPSWFVAVLVLTALVVAPIASIVIASLTGNGVKGFTLANYVEAYGTWRHIRALLNTLVLGAAVCIGAVALALPLAWAVSRTDIGAKRFVQVSVLAAFICPPYLTAAAWILLAGPNAGFINRLWALLNPAEISSPLVNLFSFTGMAFVMSASLFYFIFSYTSAALDMISSEMEEVATILGASRWRTAAIITLPLVAPAILGGIVVVFLQSIALFGVPALLAFPARYPVLVTALLEFFEVPINLGAAAAYAMPLLLITAMLTLLQRRLMRGRSYVSLTGKAGQRRLIRLGRWRMPLTLLAVLVCFIVCVLPLLALLQAALSKTWSGGLTADNMTIANFVRLVDHPGMRQAIVNSLLFAGASAVLAAIIALGIAVLVTRRKVAFGPVLAFTAMVPYVIPGMVLSIGFYATFAAPPVSLYGTGLLLILAFTVRFLPITYSGAAASLATLNSEMEEAARILGAGRLTVLARVTVPLVKRSIIASAVLVFILASHELSTAVLLTGPSTRVVSLLMLEFADNGQLENLAAMGIALMTITLVLVASSFRLIGRDFMLGRSG